MAFLNPENIVGKLNLKETMSVADFGCGSGGWTIPLAKKIKEGQVYAVDVMEESLSALKSRISSEKIANVRVVRADLEKKSTLREESIDLVIISNLLFQSESKEGIINEAYRALKRGGELLVVDWVPGTATAPEGAVSSLDIKEMAQKNGFVLQKEIDAGIYHYAHLYEKN